MSFLKKHAILILISLALLIFLTQYLKSFMTAPKNVEKQFTISVVENNSKTILENQESYLSSNTFLDISNVKVKESVSVPYIDVSEVIGAVYVPSLNIKLPITYSSNKELLNASAVVLKGGQKFGEGNFVIGANSSGKNKKLLFTSLVYAEKNEKVFVTDKDSIYLYEIESKEKINKDRTDIVDDIDSKKYLSLVTKNGSGDTEKLILVKAKFITKAKYSSSGSKLLDTFGTP